jgi:hypothetical protein
MSTFPDLSISINGTGKLASWSSCSTTCLPLVQEVRRTTSFMWTFPRHDAGLMWSYFVKVSPTLLH